MTTHTSDNTARLATLFDGYDKAHGKYEPKRTNEKGKTEGRAVTIRQPPSLHDWEAHVAGSGPGIGIIPLRSDDTVSWGCIDIDVNDINHAELEARCRKLGLPLVICRSKSGGAHCELFLSEPIPAAEIMSKLESWAAALGYGGCEVFPKQAQRYDENDIGNWLNMPYYQADMTTRYCIKDGEALELEDFLAFAESMRVTPDQLEALAIAPTNDAAELFQDGPPCLQILASNGGFPDGTRNEGMFNVAVYLKKRFGDEWQDKLQEYNLALCDPPLPLGSISATAKSVEKKEYFYKCRKAPINAFCDRRLCMTREFGIGSDDGPILGQLTKLDSDKPIWFLNVDDKRVMLDSKELFTQRMFQMKVGERTGVIVPQVEQRRWEQRLRDLMNNCTVIEVPEDLTGTGVFEALFHGYLSGQARTVTKEQLLVSMAPYVTGEGEIWFKAMGLARYLDKQGFKYDTMTNLFRMMKEYGAKDRQVRIKEKTLRIWTVPEVAPDNDGPPVQFLPKRDEF